MIRDALSNLGGVGVYGVVSISLFFALFLALLVWVFRLKKTWLNRMGRLPLEGDDETSVESAHHSNSTHHHE